MLLPANDWLVTFSLFSRDYSSVTNCLRSNHRMVNNFEILL